MNVEKVKAAVNAGVKYTLAVLVIAVLAVMLCNNPSVGVPKIPPNRLYALTIMGFTQGIPQPLARFKVDHVEFSGSSICYHDVPTDINKCFPAFFVELTELHAE